PHGPSGPNGPSSGSPSGPHSEGPHGSSGPAGPSGSHTEGPHGPSGPAGPSGPSGQTTPTAGSPSGPNEGPHGPSGPAGPHTEGPHGPSGPAGPSGQTTPTAGSPSGPNEGPHGPSGPAGPHTEGPHGPSGPSTPHPSNGSVTSVTASPSSHTTVPHSRKPSTICQEEVAIIPEDVFSESSPFAPRYFVKPEAPNKPTDCNPGERGITFPTSDKAFIIIFPLTTPAIVKSVRLPGTNNVDQIRVMFLDEHDNPISGQATENVPLQITSKLEDTPNIKPDFPKKASAVHITLLHTKNNKPPQGVTVEIIVCVESAKTTPKPSVTTPHTGATSYTNETSPPSNTADLCKPKRNPAALVTMGECVSQHEIQQDSCGGYCTSFEQMDPLSGIIAEKECLCCAPDSTYLESIVMNCHNPTTGVTEERTSQIVRIRSCKCNMCLGSAGKSDNKDITSYEALVAANSAKAKTKTRRR
ncbi:unnamed protein product, partial [Adineta steineri]